VMRMLRAGFLLYVTNGVTVKSFEASVKGLFDGLQKLNG